MRDSFRVLTVSGALVLAVAFAPVMAQPAIGINGSELPSTGATPAPQESNAGATQASPPDKPAAKKGDNTGVPESDWPKATRDAGAAKDPNAPKFDLGGDATPPAAPPAVAIPAADMKRALSILRRSTRDYEACKKACESYFDSFGVAFTFADGTIAAYSHEQRGKISGHDCVVTARNAMGRGDRSLAVQWMMAAQADILNRNWIGDHPDAMLEALRIFRGWA